VTKEMLDWSLLDLVYNIEVQGVSTIFQGKCLFNIQEEEYKGNPQGFKDFLSDKLIIKHDKPHHLYWSPLIIPSLKEMSGQDFSKIMNIKVGKKIKDTAYLMIEEEGVLADTVRYFRDYVRTSFEADGINRLLLPIIILDRIPKPKVFGLSMSY
jgi:hypothetical protein